MVKIYGRMRSAEGYAIRDFLHRCDIPFEWIELNSDEDAAKLAHVQHLGDSRLPVCELRRAITPLGVQKIQQARGAALVRVFADVAVLLGIVEVAGAVELDNFVI